MFYVNKNTMKEEFRKYNERIEVSDEGNVKVDGKPYDLSKSNTVYKRVLSHYVHRMVAELFISNPENKWYVDHIDGNRYNNKATNLRWATPSENRLNPITVERYNKSSTSETTSNKRKKSHKGQIPWQYNKKYMNDKFIEVCVDWEYVGEFIDIGFMFGKLK